MSPVYGQRFEYLIKKPDLFADKLPLYKLSTPLSIFLSNFSKNQLHIDYYVERMLIPSINRLFELVGVDVTALCQERRILLQPQTHSESDLG
ncbi:MAG: DNA polymerase zeta catalytic subunit, partial [Paramarteilia canceri]